MTNFSSLVLDILALLGGGRGSPLNEITPHLLGSIFWGSLSLYLLLTRSMRRNSTDVLLMVSFGVSFAAEFSLFLSAVLDAINHPGAPTPPLLINDMQSTLCTVGRILLTAAFMQFLLRQRDLTVKYLAISAAVVISMLLYTEAPVLLDFLGHSDLAARMMGNHMPWISHAMIMALLAYGIYRMLRSQRKIRVNVIIGISCLLMESFLTLIVELLTINLRPVLDPVRGNLQLWSIPFLAFVALRVRHVEGKRVEHGIQATERLEALGQLSSGIAHDFNNHLQIILGYTELAKTDTQLSDRQRMPLNRIEEAAESAGALVNQLLAFSRGQPPKFEPVELNEVITRLIPMLSRLLGPDIKLEHDLDLTSRKILADVHMIEQIIINLVVNSKDAIVGTGTISIQSRSLSKHDENSHTGEAGFDRIQLLVADTGTGMDEKTVRRVFEPFFTTKPVGKGTGLGLSTVYSAVQKHNGRVFVKSKPGLYTRVYIEFPVCGEAESDSPSETDTLDPAEAVSHGETVLLAEDETAIRDLAKTLLHAAGYNVLLARDGQHAINIMSTYKANIDLCIFDVTMPVLNGYDTYDRVADIRPGTPALFITGNTSRVAHVRSHLPHLQKPFSKAALFKEIRRILDKAPVS